jgi:hypothetical protein
MMNRAKALLCIAGAAASALLAGCAPASQSSAMFSRAGSAPAELPFTPVVTFDGYDARQVWTLCLNQFSDNYSDAVVSSIPDYRDFFLDSLAMPGSAPIDVLVRFPVVFDPDVHGTLVCYIGGGPASPYVVSLAPAGF